VPPTTSTEPSPHRLPGAVSRARSSRGELDGIQARLSPTDAPAAIAAGRPVRDFRVISKPKRRRNATASARVVPVRTGARSRSAATSAPISAVSPAGALQHGHHPR
jgi:hypothetical protein